jgi:AcrR family transcriptional regulator
MGFLATESGAVERSPRADALRNRAKVIGGARATFAEEGLEADIASIARRAGVGVGTVYRHFATKEALLQALALDHFERLADLVEEVVAEDLEAWEAVEQMVWRTATYSAQDAGMCEILARQSPEIASTAAAGRLREVSGRLVDVATRAGAMRADATVDDISMMMCGFGRIAAIEQAGGAVDWRRYLRVMLDGLRAR